jgi:hypothetical protein
LDQRLLALTAHPDYNQAFMQELVVSDYFKHGHISPDMNYKSYKNCQRWIDDGRAVQRDDRELTWKVIR